MKDTRRSFSETLFDWAAQPTNVRAGALFQPKGLGTALPFKRRRRGSQRALMVLTLMATGAAACVSILELARAIALR